MRHTTLLFLLLAGALSVVLFSVKYQVQDLEQEMVDLNKSIIDERQSIHVLQAEWSHLNDPQRLRVLATRYLGMKPVDATRMVSFEGLKNLQMRSLQLQENASDLAISAASGEGRQSP
jgi:cell division protein FtsL